MRTNLEKGQVIVILAVAFVALLGLSAVAIDVGLAYVDRRSSQNIADTAALAGAQAAATYMESHNLRAQDFSCANIAKPGDVLGGAINAATAAAIKRASTNGVALDTNLADQHGVQVLCSAANNAKYIDVRVQVTTKVNTSFIHLFNASTAVNTVIAETRIRPRDLAAFGNAIVALRQTCDDEIQVNGDPTIIVDHGGVFSNGCIGFRGSAGSMTVQNGGIYHMNGFSASGHPTVSPAAAQASTPLPRPNIPEPACSSLPERSTKGDGTILPGRYGEVKLTGQEKLVLSPGLYCFSGDLQVTSGSIEGTGVTLYFESGYFLAAGNAEVKLAAATSNANGAIKGLLFYTDENNPCTTFNDNNKRGCVDMQGNSDSWYTGTVYVPKGKVALGGEGTVNPTYGTQIIADKVAFHGNGDIHITFTNDQIYECPTNLEMRR